jgi:hypothetical protein
MISKKSGRETLRINEPTTRITRAVSWLKENYRKAPIVIGTSEPKDPGFILTLRQFQIRPKLRFVSLPKNKQNKP